MTRRGGLRRQATSARKRHAFLAVEIDSTAGQPFRSRLWVLVRWLMAEASAAPPAEQEQLLGLLKTTAADMNARRQTPRRST